jgi:hypothetical protein
MRAAVVGFALLTLAIPVVAQPGAYSSDEGKFRVKFPGAPKVTEQTAKSAIGELKVTAAIYANSDGSLFMVSFTDFPEAATKPANHETLLNGIRDHVKGSGKLMGDEKNLTFGQDKLPYREFVVEKDKPKQRIKCRVIIRGERVYQLAVIGPSDFASGKEATAFLESFDLTK